MLGDSEEWRYASLAEGLLRISAQPKEDSVELFKRIVFNALISNDDDTPGNHAIIANHAGWKLSPAYDLRPSMEQLSLKHRHLAMNCGIHGCQANASNLLSEAHRFLLREEEATVIIDAMEDRISNTWYGIARRAGVSEMD